MANLGQFGPSSGRQQRTRLGVPPALPGPEDDAGSGRAHDQKSKAVTTALPLALVESPEQAFGQEREQLDESDAGIALVEVRPVRCIDRDPPEDFVQERLVDTVVDDGRGQRHRETMTQLATAKALGAPGSSVGGDALHGARRSVVRRGPYPWEVS